jgi:hypothetical protein
MQPLDHRREIGASPAQEENPPAPPARPPGLIQGPSHPELARPINALRAGVGPVQLLPLEVRCALEGGVAKGELISLE